MTAPQPAPDYDALAREVEIYAACFCTPDDTCSRHINIAAALRQAHAAGARAAGERCAAIAKDISMTWPIRRRIAGLEIVSAIATAFDLPAPAAQAQADEYNVAEAEHYASYFEKGKGG